MKNKGHRIAILCTTALVFIVALVIVVHFVNSKMQRDEYIQVSSIDALQGEQVSLDSVEDEKGRAYGYTAALDWHGTMKVSLETSRVYQSYEGLNMEPAYFFSDQPEDSVFLVCQLKISNVNATLNTAYTSPRASMQGYSIDIFALQIGDEKKTIAYFDGVSTGAEGTNRKLYDIVQGEEKVVTIGYFISAQDIEKDIYYRIGISQTAEKYKIHLNIDESSMKSNWAKA